MLNLCFKVKADVDVDKYRILELFLKDWIDDTCNNEVHYDISERGEYSQYSPYPFHTQYFNVEFDRSEDALAVKLKGIPEMFQNYVEIVS